MVTADSYTCGEPAKCTELSNHYAVHPKLIILCVIYTPINE